MAENKEQLMQDPVINETMDEDQAYDIKTQPFGVVDAELRDNPDYRFTRIGKDTPIQYKEHAPHISRELIDHLINSADTTLKLNDFKGEITEVTVHLGGSNIFISLENETGSKLNLHFEAEPPFEIYHSEKK